MDVRSTRFEVYRVLTKKSTLEMSVILQGQWNEPFQKWNINHPQVYSFLLECRLWNIMIQVHMVHVYTITNVWFSTYSLSHLARLPYLVFQIHHYWKNMVIDLVYLRIKTCVPQQSNELINEQPMYTIYKYTVWSGDHCPIQLFKLIDRYV